MAWKRGESGAHAYEFGDSTTIPCYIYYIYIYTREKKGRKKAEKVEDSVEKLNNQIVRSREGRFITINTFGLMEGARVYINLNLVSKKAKKRKKMSFYRVSNSYVFQTSMDPR